jgi:hypothetical protein
MSTQQKQQLDASVIMAKVREKKKKKEKEDGDFTVLRLLGTCAKQTPRAAGDPAQLLIHCTKNAVFQ